MLILEYFTFVICRTFLFDRCMINIYVVEQIFLICFWIKFLLFVP